MRAGAVVVLIGVGMWMMLIGGLAEENYNGLTSVDGRDRGALVGAAAPGSAVTEGDDLSILEEDASEPEATPEPTPTPQAAEPEPESEAAGRVHVVESGDTMARIAQAHGVSLQALLAANPQISDPARIEIGQEVNIPE